MEYKDKYMNKNKQISIEERRKMSFMLVYGLVAFIKPAVKPRHLWRGYKAVVSFS